MKKLWIHVYKLSMIFASWFMLWRTLFWTRILSSVCVFSMLEFLLKNHVILMIVLSQKPCYTADVRWDGVGSNISGPSKANAIVYVWTKKTNQHNNYIGFPKHLTIHNLLSNIVPHVVLANLASCEFIVLWDMTIHAFLAIESNGCMVSHRYCILP